METSSVVWVACQGRAVALNTKARSRSQRHNVLHNTYICNFRFIYTWLCSYEVKAGELHLKRRNREKMDTSLISAITLIAAQNRDSFLCIHTRWLWRIFSNSWKHSCFPATVPNNWLRFFGLRSIVSRPQLNKTPFLHCLPMQWNWLTLSYNCIKDLETNIGRHYLSHRVAKWSRNCYQPVRKTTRLNPAEAQAIRLHARLHLHV